MEVVISSLFDMRHFRGNVSHVLSIVDPDDIDHIPDLGLPRKCSLVLTCDDVDSVAEARRRESSFPGSKCMAPTVTMVRNALAFSDGLPSEARLLIHCGHGISRSPAVAFAVLCQCHPLVSERKIFEAVLKLQPHASPNLLIVDLADKLLRREGRMLEALRAHVET